ncbi:MAG: hypothetical protein WDZ32_01635 [Candidatus Saccharimonadales bacterium]
MCSRYPRTNKWLEDLFESTYSLYFSDIEKTNTIKIEFGRRAKGRLGSINIRASDPDLSLIRVNGWFRHQCIPESIVQSVIVHELCHYAHGFNSGSDSAQYKYPHSGGVVKNEFAERGLEGLYKHQSRWIKEEWPKFLQEHHSKPITRSKPKQTYSSRIITRLKYF